MYLKRRSLMEHFDTSESTVDRTIRFIKKGIDERRYPATSIIWMGATHRSPRVDEEVFRKALGGHPVGEDEMDKVTALIAMVGLICAAGLDSENWLTPFGIMIGCFAWVIGYCFWRQGN